MNDPTAEPETEARLKPSPARAAVTPAPRARKSAYHLPPGLRHNLVWYAFRKFRPADPIGLFQYLAREHGDIVHYKIGPEHILFLNRADYIRQVLVVQNDNFTKERTVQRTKMLLGEGMITSEGSEHRAQRQTAQPAFHRQRVVAYAKTMVDETISLRESWTGGKPLDVSTEMMHLTLRIVARTLFNTELGGEVHELGEAINTIMRLYNYLVALPAVEVLIHMRVPGLGRFAGAKRDLDTIVYRMIDEHRRKGISMDSGDLLDMMLRASESSSDASSPMSTRGLHAAKADELLRDQVITIFLAGYETVASALTWTWYLLSQNPEAERQMHQEIDAVLAGRAPTADDVPNLKFVEMVFAESMRLYPPAWAMGRRAREDFSLGPYRMPAGTTVLISQFIAHRDSRNFANPLSFTPERFAPAGKATFPKFSYFPFGAGFRQCIGEALAWTEGILVLATIAQKWRLRLAPGHRAEVQPLITLRAKYGMPMLTEER